MQLLDGLLVEDFKQSKLIDFLNIVMCKKLEFYIRDKDIKILKVNIFQYHNVSFFKFTYQIFTMIYKRHSVKILFRVTFYY